MAQRWVTEEELQQLSQQFENGGTTQPNPLQQFFEQLPPELQEKIMMLPPEKQQEVLMQLMQKAQQQQPAEQQQFVIGGKIDNYSAVQDSLANSMYSPDGKFFSNRQQYLDYQNLYYPQPLEDNLNQSITNNYFIKKYKPRIKNSFEEGGETQGIPVEAERNETLTTQDGSIPNTEGGYLERKSFNPISGQATYEIPDNEHNQTHPEGGVNMVLKKGDVVNSDKTKIPTDFKVYGKNFKGKTFKEASDFLSKKEEDIQKQLTELQKEGKADRVSENSVSIMLAKTAINRNELNELQEQVLESKKQKEHNQSLEGNIKQFGGLVKNATKAEEVYNKTLDRFLNGYTTERPVLKAEKGLSASISKMQSFTDKIAANPNMSTQDVMAAFKQSGLYNQSSESTSIYKPNFAPIKNGSSAVGNFKEMIASKESNAYKNPYISMSGIDEATASKLTYNELRPKASSSAIGKYQIVWDLHKNDIKKVTGVSDPEVFRRNPKAQESFMDWFRDNRLLPQATQVKQKYQVPMSIEQIMAGIHLEGMGSEKKKNGFIGKYLSGQLNTSTMAGNFKNASTSNYMQGFEHGGYIADGGFNFRNVSDFNEKNWNDLNNQSQQTLGKTFQTPEEYQGFMMQNYPELIREMFHKGFWSNTNQGESIPTTIPFDDKELQQAFVDKKYNRRGFIPKEQVFDTKEDYENFIKDSPSVKQGNNIYYFDPSQNTWIMPDTKEINYSVTDQGLGNAANKPNPNILNKSKANSYVPLEEEDSTTTSGQNKEASWLDKLKYGMRESLPYLDNLRLMREGRIMPTLQQRPYDNPYDNMRTDYNIQSNLNENQRALLTTIADSTGNPSVRNARLAQLAANAANMNNQLYSQKYNQELAMENQKTLGQGNYRNQFNLDNMNLQKRYEQEVLQTIENQRQQKHMASNKMMNDYLRKQEQDQARDLALLETNYDWNPYSGNFEFNPKKAEQNMAYKKATFSSSSNKNSDVITIGGNKYIKKKNGNLECLDCDDKSQTTKYGGKIKRK